MNFFCRKKTFFIHGKSQELLEIIRNNSNKIMNCEFSMRQLNSNSIEFTPIHHFTLQRAGSVPRILLSYYMSEEGITFDVVCKLSNKYLVFDLIISILLLLFEFAIIFKMLNESIVFERTYIVPIMIPLILMLFINLFLILNLKYYSRKVFAFYHSLNFLAR